MPVAAGDVVHLRFERATPNPRQGVWLATQGSLQIASASASQFVLWRDTSPKVVEITVLETDGLLRFYNVFEREPGTGSFLSHMNAAGMISQGRDDGWIEYGCNDFGVGQGFEKLVFSVLVPRQSPQGR